MNKYIIVNAETIQKEIEILENLPNSMVFHMKISTLKQILSNSKPLEEELKKAFSAGMSYGIEQALDVYEKTSPEPDLNTYISNINLDI